jgi:hypothetical protein
MLLEPKLGKLIRRLNPYTNGGFGTMLLGVDPANIAVLGADLSALGQRISDYATTPNPVNLQNINTAEDKFYQDLSIADLPLRVDNDFRQDYMNWSFRNQAYAVKRALRITYRYELTDPPAIVFDPALGAAGAAVTRRTGTGIFATEDVLIGYAGANG